MAARHFHFWVAASLLAATLQAHAAAPLLPTAPLRSAHADGCAAGLERSEPLAQALLHVAAIAPENTRRELLAVASQADPTLATPHLQQARLALRARDFAGACEAVAAAVHAVRLDARSEAIWLQRAAHATHTLLTATLATLALLFGLRGVRLARHAFGERLGSYTAASLLLVVPVVAALVVSPALALLVVLAALVPLARWRERACLAVLAGALAWLELLLPGAAPHALLLDPRTRVAQIEALNVGASDAGLEARVAERHPPAAAAELVLGLAARRRGDLDAARAHTVACVGLDARNAAAYVNLANLLYRSGDYERAAAGYRAAQSADPAAPLPHANLAQTYIHMIHYGEADAEQRAAAARGMLAVQQRREFWRDEACPVLDQTLTKTEILALARSEAERDRAAASTALQAWRSRPWQSVRLGVAPWLLLLVAIWLVVPTRFRSVTRACAGCGTMVCTHCTSSDGDAPLCTACVLEQHRAVARPEPEAPEDGDGEAAAVTVTPLPRRRMGLASGRWMAPLFPGGPDVARGDALAALCTTLCAWAALLLVASRFGAARLHADPWYAAADLATLRAACITFFVLWLVGLLRLRRQPRRGALVVQRTTAGG
jgi:tetratricopeptide (TPR) repeat protein